MIHKQVRFNECGLTQKIMSSIDLRSMIPLFKMFDEIDVWLCDESLGDPNEIDLKMIAEIYSMITEYGLLKNWYSFKIINPIHIFDNPEICKRTWTSSAFKSLARNYFTIIDSWELYTNPESNENDKEINWVMTRDLKTVVDLAGDINVKSVLTRASIALIPAACIYNGWSRPVTGSTNVICPEGLHALFINLYVPPRYKLNPPLVPSLPPKLSWVAPAS